MGYILLITYKNNTYMITGAQLVEHLYSQGYYIEEQREFGIVSGTNKVMRKLSRKLGITDKLKKSIESDNEKIKQANEAVKSIRTSSKNNIEVIKNLGKEAKKYGIKTIKGKRNYKNIDPFNRGLDRSIPWETSRDAVGNKRRVDLVNSFSKERSEVGKAIIDNNSVVNNIGTQAGYAHEIGHGLNRIKNLLGKYQIKTIL